MLQGAPSLEQSVQDLLPWDQALLASQLEESLQDQLLLLLRLQLEMQLQEVQLQYYNQQLQLEQSLLHYLQWQELVQLLDQGFWQQQHYYDTPLGKRESATIYDNIYFYALPNFFPLQNFKQQLINIIKSKINSRNSLMDLKLFRFKQFLSTNPTQKRIVALGTLQDKQGQAIIILNAKMPNQQKYEFIDIKNIFDNDIYSKFDVTMAGEYDIQAIYPVNDKHKNKYRQKFMFVVKQTAHEYKLTEEQVLKKELTHIGWVKNIIQGKAQAERVLFRGQHFIILPDFKFSNLHEIQNLHLLAIFTDYQLHSIRDLRGVHLNLLKQCQSQIGNVLQTKLKIERGSCRMFFHYPPTFYQLHIHVTILPSQAANALAERAHLLQNVIQNLSIDGEYYSKVTLMKTVQKQSSK